MSGGRVGLAVSLLLLGLAPRPAAAIFRFDEVRPRDFDFNVDHFLNVFSYRERLTHRWRWQDAAMGYRVTAGSLTSDELYLSHEAVVRVPFAGPLGAEYRFVETEDYDARWARHEVELALRFARPDYRLALPATLGRTPPLDGFFVGGLGLLDADKEFSDVGLILGWHDGRKGLRLDVISPDFFYEGKADAGSEYTSAPYTFRARGDVALLGGDLWAQAWVEHDLPLRLVLPQDGDLVFRYRQTQAGLDVRWRAAPGVRLDVTAWGERTRKRRRAFSRPADSDTVDREAFKGWAAAEVDVAPALASSSRARDVVLLGAHVHLLDEDTDALVAARDQVQRRGEAYLELGYVLGLPSPHAELEWGLRAQAQNGFLGLRDVREETGRHRVTEKFLSKLGLGLELVFREDLVMGFLQFTFRVDDLTFGGGNVQVMMRF